MSMIGPQITQGIPFPGKQGARSRAAEAEVQVREGELERLRRGIVEEVRDTYAALYALDHERRILGGGKDLADLLSATVAHHQMTAEADQEAAFKARLVLSRIEERLEDLNAERRMAVARLNRLLDRPGDSGLGRVDSLDSPVVPPLPWDSLAVAVSAEVATARASVLAAEGRTPVAELESRPDFMVGAGVGFRGDMDAVVAFRLGRARSGGQPVRPSDEPRKRSMPPASPTCGTPKPGPDPKPNPCGRTGNASRAKSSATSSPSCPRAAWPSMPREPPISGDAAISPPSSKI
jgi:hypothetical protein